MLSKEDFETYFLLMLQQQRVVDDLGEYGRPLASLQRQGIHLGGGGFQLWFVEDARPEISANRNIGIENRCGLVVERHGQN